MHTKKRKHSRKGEDEQEKEIMAPKKKKNRREAEKFHQNERKEIPRRDVRHKAESGSNYDLRSYHFVV